MTKTNVVPEKSVATPKPATAAPVRLSLTEFCMRLSEQDRRVALLGAFEFSERNAGNVQDTEAAFNARFKAFTNKPA